MTPHVRCQTKEPLMLITLARPEKLNALTMEMVQGIREGLQRAAEDPSVRVVILTGGEKVFCSGADISIEKSSTPLEFRQFVEHIQDITRDIQALDKMVIAAVSGYALGGGAEIALACDLRVFSETATLGFPEVGLGLTITSGASYLLPRMVGLGRAKDMVLLGRRVDAAEAQSLGAGQPGCAGTGLAVDCRGVSQPGCPHASSCRGGAEAIVKCWCRRQSGSAAPSRDGSHRRRHQYRGCPGRNERLFGETLP